MSTLPFSLRPARVHEAYGPAACTFALFVAQGAGAPVLWICASWKKQNLLPDGITSFLSPQDILLATPRNQTDALAIAEEALKDGGVKLVVFETMTPLNLREGRRLQLAAKMGGGLGLCLIPEGMGSNAAETRWHCAPVYDPKELDSTLMHWALNKNKSGTIGAWHVRWNRKAHHLDMVSTPPLREGAA